MVEKAHDIQLDIRGDDGDGLRFEKWLAEVLTRGGRASSADLARLLSERIDRRPAAQAPMPTRQERRTRNNVMEPAAESTTGRVWEIIYDIQGQDGTVDRQDVMDQCIGEGINPSTAASQWGRWNRFHGMKRGKPA